MLREWNQRCVMVLMWAMAAALAVGLLAWGPVPLTAREHVYADLRPLLGIPHGANVLASLPLLCVALWGASALRHGAWPLPVARPLRLFFVVSACASVVAALYHLAPDHSGYVMAHMLMAAGFMLLLGGFLAERVDPRFGSRAACAAALLLPLAAGAWCGLSALTTGTPDLRGLLLLQVLPVLLVPAGALGLSGSVTRTRDWMAMLGLYALAKGFELADATIHDLTAGWVGGHALMHLALAAVAAWLAYRAASSAPREGHASASPLRDADTSAASATPSSRITSASTLSS